MQKFKTLNFTYEKLVSEVDFLTKHCIEKNAEFNDINTKVSNGKNEVKLLDASLADKKLKNEAEIKKFNKDYESELIKKENKQNSLSLDLKIKGIELNDKSQEIEKLDISLQNNICKLEVREKEVNTQSNNIKKESSKLDIREEEVEQKEDDMNIYIKDKKKELSNIEDKIKEARKQDEKEAQERQLEIHIIKSQKELLGSKEKELNNKQEKIDSDMRVLLSAKEYVNEQSDTWNKLI